MVIPGRNANWTRPVSPTRSSTAGPCPAPIPLQRICDRLGPGAVKSFFRRWQAQLPSPFTRADLRAGYIYELALRQFEISDTRVFDHPTAGRAFFEGLIRDHLNVGRPALVSLIFGRRVDRRTPGTFQTKVRTKEVEPRGVLLLPLILHQASHLSRVQAVILCAPAPN
jgi:hypothetical protein